MIHWRDCWCVVHKNVSISTGVSSCCQQVNKITVGSKHNNDNDNKFSNILQNIFFEECSDAPQFTRAYILNCFYFGKIDVKIFMMCDT